MPETQTQHYNDDGEQVTEREVRTQGDTYRFEVDLDADDQEDGHTYQDGDRGDVPEEVEQALREFGAGAPRPVAGGEANGE
jgi:hypothetical protein